MPASGRVVSQAIGAMCSGLGAVLGNQCHVSEYLWEEPGCSACASVLVHLMHTETFFPCCCSRQLCRVSGGPSKRTREAVDVEPMELESDAIENIQAPVTKALRAAGDARGAAPGAPGPACAPPAAQEGDCLVYVRPSFKRILGLPGGWQYPAQGRFLWLYLRMRASGCCT